MVGETRPSLPQFFYSDIRFVEDLIDLTCKVGEGIYAGQQRAFGEGRPLVDYHDIEIEDDSEIGNIQLLKWEAIDDWFEDMNEEEAKKSIKLLIKIPSNSNVLTKAEGKYFLTVPDGDAFWEGKYELIEEAGTDESTSINSDPKSIQLSNGKKLRPNPWSFFKCNNFISNSWILTEDEYDDDIDPLKIPILKDLADQHFQKNVEEGVLSCDSLVPDNIHKELVTLVLALQDSQKPKDYHPHSQQMVQDLVHPALFCYVAGESYTPEVLKPVVESLPDRNNDSAFLNKTSDLFGRNYEESKYQWLPTDVTVEIDGRARFLSPINNLDTEQVKLHDTLEQLLTLAIPYFEEALGFVNRIGRLMHPADDGYYDGVKAVDDASLFVPLRGKRIQVIPKIVTYHLKPGQMYEGVWHVEGMSHENIVATGLYILKRDENLSGGELMFKRQYTVEESSQYTMGVPQGRNIYAEEMIRQGYQPLGKIATPQGRFIVFPNSHAHKLTKLQNCGDEPSSRTIVVFFLVHPAVRLISTAQVPNQNWTEQRPVVKALIEQRIEEWGLPSDNCESALLEILEFCKWGFTLEEAKVHRLELMKERKYNKQTWNIREVELCEH